MDPPRWPVWEGRLERKKPCSCVSAGASHEESRMEYRKLGGSGLMVPALSLGTGTFGGAGFLKAWGSTQAAEATRLVDICLEAGLNLFDSADVYSDGLSEEVLGQAI